MKWVIGTHTVRCHAHDHTADMERSTSSVARTSPSRASNISWSSVDMPSEVRCVPIWLIERKMGMGLTTALVRKAEPTPKLLSAWPIPRFSNRVDRVNSPLTEKEFEAVRPCAHRAQLLGDEQWMESTAWRLKIKSTLRPIGRPKKSPVPSLKRKNET